jgi:hypothetical protein
VAESAVSDLAFPRGAHSGKTHLELRRVPSHK